MPNQIGGINLRNNLEYQSRPRKAKRNGHELLKQRKKSASHIV